MTRRRLALLSWLVFALATEAVASVIIHQKLEQVLSLGTPVVRARVLSTRVERWANSLTVSVRLGQVRALRGTCPEEVELSYSYSTLLERAGPNGEKIRVSPIRSGSGLETEIVEGEEYFFVLEEDDRFFLRAESLESESRIRAALEEG